MGLPHNPRDPHVLLHAEELTPLSHSESEAVEDHSKSSAPGASTHLMLNLFESKKLFHVYFKGQARNFRARHEAIPFQRWDSSDLVYSCQRISLKQGHQYHHSLVVLRSPTLPRCLTSYLIHWPEFHK